MLNSDCIPQVNLKDSRKQLENVFEAFIVIKVKLFRKETWPRLRSARGSDRVQTSNPQVSNVRKPSLATNISNCVCIIPKALTFA